MDANEGVNIRNVATPEQSALYGELIGAWSEDGQELLAAASTVEELAEVLDHLGVTRFLIGRIPAVDSWMGCFSDDSIMWESDSVGDQGAAP